MSEAIAAEIWGELKRFVNTVDRNEAAETVVQILMDNDSDVEDIRTAFKGDTDIKRALTAYLDNDKDYSEDEEEDPEEAIPESERPKPFNWLILMPAALLDLCATSAMYIGLTLTSASSFQMLRGSVIIFTGVFSWLILGHRLRFVMIKLISVL